MVNEDDRLKVVEHGSMQGGVINDLSSQLLDNTTGMFSQKEHLRLTMQGLFDIISSD